MRPGLEAKTLAACICSVILLCFFELVYFRLHLLRPGLHALYLVETFVGIHVINIHRWFRYFHKQLIVILNFHGFRGAVYCLPLLLVAKPQVCCCSFNICFQTQCNLVQTENSDFMYHSRLSIFSPALYTLMLSSLL